MEKNFAVNAQGVGERLDKWLCRKLPNFSRKQIKALLDDGRVKVNGRRVVIAGWELEENDSVDVMIPPKFGSSAEKSEMEIPEAKPEGARTGEPRYSVVGEGIARSVERHFQKRQKKRVEISEGKKDPGAGRGRLKIYYEDRDIIVVEKPAGIQTIFSQNVAGDGDNLKNMVHAYLRRKHKDSKGSFVFPLHRLDEETSGVMVFALSNVGKQLEKQFRDHSIRREYVAVVSGRMERESGAIKGALEKGSFGHGRKVRISTNGKAKPAITEYRVGERYKNATLVNLNVRTGRTHQIRVHLSSEGHPIIGDKLYGGKHGETAHKLSRHALHARLLVFKHPKTGRKMKFSSPIPYDMRELIDSLRTLR